MSVKRINELVQYNWTGHAVFHSTTKCDNSKAQYPLYMFEHFYYYESDPINHSFFGSLTKNIPGSFHPLRRPLKQFLFEKCFYRNYSKNSYINPSVRDIFSINTFCKGPAAYLEGIIQVTYCR